MFLLSIWSRAIDFASASDAVPFCFLYQLINPPDPQLPTLPYVWSFLPTTFWLSIWSRDIVFSSLYDKPTFLYEIK
jgi:hypothetical protein